MKATFNRPKGIHIWEMCKYVDEHMEFVVNGAHTKEEHDIEEQIVQYLYFIIDSLARTAGFFKSFEDYDEFSLYGAGELFITLRNKYLNEGKQIRGKIVEPTKSSLNYIKSVLYPLKVNYQNSTFDPVANPALGHNTDKLREDMREEIREQYRKDAIEELSDILDELPQKTYEILRQTPYRNDEVMVKRLYLSCMLSFINNITLPNKIRNKIDIKIEKDKIDKDKLSNIYQTNDFEILLWHLPSYMTEYVRILVVRIKRIITDELGQRRNSMDLSDEVVDSIMATAFTTYDQDMEKD